MPLEAGTKLGPYEILDVLGAGGMGEVYLARDTKLQRDVAIKVLPEAFSKDKERLLRFQREARILASLNHPNIAAIYSLEDSESQCYLVLEFVRGKTLADILNKGPLPLKEVLSIGSQIATALEEAHAKGIIHRDLKPANVKITPEGTVKVLDFGLAKMVTPDSAEISHLATFAEVETQHGVIVGTVAYMSPEQARGKPLDKETDIWSFGCVLFELLSARRPFRGETVSDIIAAILQNEPDWTLLPGSIPKRMQELLSRCLQKDLHHRLRDVGDARIEMKELLNPSTVHTTVPPASKKRTVTFVIVGLVAVLTGLLFVLRNQQTKVVGEKQFISETQDVPRPVLFQLTSSTGLEAFPAWSPDGKSIAFSGELSGFKKLFVKDLQSRREIQLTSTSSDDIQPTWSSTGDSLLFTRSNQPDGKLELGDVFGEYSNGDIWRYDFATKREQKILENAFNPSFSPDGKWLAVDASWAGPRRIWIVNSLGSNPQQMTSDVSEAVSHVIPRWSPDGKKIVFQCIERTKFDIKTVDVGSRKIDSITNDLFTDINPVWSKNYIYFTSDRSGGWNVWRLAANSKGPSQQITTGAGQDVQLAISADGSQMAFTILRQNADLWRLPTSKNGDVVGQPSEVVSSTREDSRGAWSPDGKTIAFNSDRDANMNIWIFSHTNSLLQQLTKGPGGDYQPTWSPDGKEITFFSSRAGNADIWKMDSRGNKPVQLTKGHSMEINPFFSPSGKLIAFQSDQSGRLELWVMNADGSNQRRITDAGIRGHFMRWSHDGQSIFFRASAGKQIVLKVSVKGEEPSTVGDISGGSHISFSPDQSLIMDVIGHKQIWVSSLKGGKPRMVFEFDDPEIRVDYPVWSPDGKWILFDKFQPQGGDIWLMKNFE